MEGDGEGRSAAGPVSDLEGASGAGCDECCFELGRARTLGMAFGAGATLGSSAAPKASQGSLGFPSPACWPESGKSSSGSGQGELGGKESARWQATKAVTENPPRPGAPKKIGGSDGSSSAGVTGEGSCKGCVSADGCAVSGSSACAERVEGEEGGC